MEVKEIMTKGVDLIAPEGSIKEAASRMRDDDVGVLPVGAGDELVGMVTDRDIVTRLIADGADVANAKVKDAMTDKVLYCFDDQSVDEVASNMSENQIRRLPVVNREKRLVGMVTLGDIAAKASAGEAGDALSGVAKKSA